MLFTNTKKSMSHNINHKGFCIKEPDRKRSKGTIRIETLRYNRSTCIEAWTQTKDKEEWEKYRKHGWTVVKVVVVPTNPAAPEHNFKRDLRAAVADYMSSEGCSCCRNNEAHEIHAAALGKLLSVRKYKDGSGYNFSKYKTKKKK